MSTQTSTRYVVTPGKDCHDLYNIVDTKTGTTLGCMAYPADAQSRVDTMNAQDLPAFNHTDQLPGLNDYMALWFSKPTMRFFNSKVYGSIHYGRYFISSEVMPEQSRRFTIRFVNDQDRIDTIGDMCQYATYTIASKALDKMIASGDLTAYATDIKDARS